MERALASSRDRQPAPPVKKRRIRLMIVDDSVVARSVLSRMVASDDAFELVASAGTAEDAIDALHEVRVDIVILDLEMPGAGGLKSIPRIIRAASGFFRRERLSGSSAGPIAPRRSAPWQLAQCFS